ncbi:YceI family protein [Sphingomonas quercus]|uniref:YceI family protein n=1 Tax=Sphingomonas quercus TaxID=2842451 RepID=A0ABS6BNQ4_9SPHN|nr:YceI family protein [Sphingomonas quercus]MBU3078879.1 YceI family protein [Sphingomonas quercus]
MRRGLLLPLALLAVASATGAQAPNAIPGAPDPSRVAAGTYQVEPGHTQILFGVDHLGFTPYYGHFSEVSGTLTIDPARPAAAALDVTVPVASVRTTSTRLDEELASPMFFDAAKFPTMRFRSTAIQLRQAGALVQGELTLHGVTRPVALEVLFHGAGTNPNRKTATIGFEGRAHIKRSEFGVTYGLPGISDEVTVIIAAAFEKPAG